MKRIPFIILVCLAASCSGSASADIPVWRWTDGEVQGGEAVTEPHPSIVELGWTNVTAAFTAVPEGIAVYRSPEALDGVKAVAYIAVADLQKIHIRKQIQQSHFCLFSHISGKQIATACP